MKQPRCTSWGEVWACASAKELVWAGGDTSWHNPLKAHRLFFACTICMNLTYHQKSSTYLSSSDHCVPPQLLPVLPCSQFRAYLISLQVRVWVSLTSGPGTWWPLAKCLVVTGCILSTRYWTQIWHQSPGMKTACQMQKPQKKFSSLCAHEFLLLAPRWCHVY